MKERDKQMSALVGDAGEVRRAGLCRRGAERRLIGAGRTVRVRDQRMQPLISLLLALTHLLMELHGSDTAVYLEKLTPETNLQHTNNTDQLQAGIGYEYLEKENSHFRRNIKKTTGRNTRVKPAHAAYSDGFKEKTLSRLGS